VIASIVVSDTSPLRALAHLDLVHLLPRLFGAVFIPEAVSNELAQRRELLPTIQVTSWPFIQVRPVIDLSRARPFIQDLHAGEAQAIALALEIGSTYLLIDEFKGRNMARAAGLRPMGVLGLLIEAKKSGLIPLVGPLMDRLASEINFFVFASVRDDILKLACESPK